MAGLLTTALSAQADSKQVLTVNGETVEKVVERITFDSDDKVVLTYTDQTTEAFDMEQVSIAFSVETAIEALAGEPADAPIVYFDMSGRQLKEAPRQGSYLMKKGNTVVKLIKK